MITHIYNHMDGIDVIPETIMNEIKSVISDYNPVVERNAVSKIKNDIMNELLLRGWSKEFRIDYASRITISSYSHGIGLCFQTGNYGRVYADLLKLQALYIKGKISAGIILVPMKEIALMLGSNMANYERLTGELPIFAEVINIPLTVIGFCE